MEQDKLNFAKNCKYTETGFKSRKKLLKRMGISFIFPAIVAICMSIVYPVFLGIVFFEVLLYGSFATYAHMCNRDDINECNVGSTNFTYKDYKEMKKSGELDKLYQHIEELNKKEAEKNYQQYLRFVEGKSYTPVKTLFVEKNQDTKDNNDVEINNNL